MSEYQVKGCSTYALRAPLALRWLAAHNAPRPAPCSLGGCGPPARRPALRARGESSPKGQQAGTRRGAAFRRSARYARQAAFFWLAPPPTPGSHAPAPPALRKSGMWRAASLVRLPVGSPSCGRFFASSRAAAPLRWARPLRAARPGPALASPLRVAGPLGCPPALSLGPCAPLPAPWALAAAPALWLPLGALRAPCSVALASLVGALAQRVGLPGPPVLAPFGASGPGPPRPGLSPPSGGGFPPRPGLFFLLACCARCADPPAGILPCAPPVPAAPAGGSGEAPGLFQGACGPPCCFAARLPRG